MKECILIVNHDTGEYRLEKLSSNIAVKKTRLVTKLSYMSLCSVSLVIQLLFSFLRAEGSSKIQSRIEQQTNRLSQQMKSGSGSRVQSSTKSSPPKEKMSPSSPMDEIERGNY